MKVVTAKEFNSNLEKYFDFVAQEEPVVVTRPNGKSFLITEWTDKEEVSSDLLAVLQRGFDDIKNGNYIVLKDDEKVWDAIP